MTLVIWEPSTCSGGQLKTEAVGFFRVILHVLTWTEIIVVFSLYCTCLICDSGPASTCSHLCGRHTSVAHEAGDRSERFVL